MIILFQKNENKIETKTKKKNFFVNMNGRKKREIFFSKIVRKKFDSEKYYYETEQ